MVLLRCKRCSGQKPLDRRLLRRRGRHHGCKYLDRCLLCRCRRQMGAGPVFRRFRPDGAGRNSWIYSIPVNVNAETYAGSTARYNLNGYSQFTIYASTNDVVTAGGDVLCMLRFQEQLERLAWQQGGRRQTAPAQRMADFVNNRLSYDLPKSSYAPGLVSSPLHFWMPKEVAGRLQQGFQYFGKQRHGFLTNEACLIATETRTSAPVRITRDAETLQHVTIRGLFPCGEGAGYAGGIVSAGVDGERCADMLAEMY